MSDAPDWKVRAAQAWDAPGWREAAIAHRKLAAPVRQQSSEPRNRPTPEVVVDALVYCVRQRGLAALQEPANLERLSRCDASSKYQLNYRIERLGDLK